MFEIDTIIEFLVGTTNLQMMQWSIENDYTLPMDIIALMITYG